MITIALFLACAAVIFTWVFDRERRRVEGQGGNPCPHCGYDLRGGHERCPECGQKIPRDDDEDDDAGGLFDDMLLATPLSPRTPTPEEKLIAACYTSSSIEAAFVTSVLENHGISVLLEGQPRPTDYQPAEMRLMVWSDDGEAAAELVAEIRRRQAERRAAEK